ncbi:MAG: hypothetical protein AAF479_05570 [Pseudomonadota bacterium]
MLIRAVIPLLVSTLLALPVNAKPWNVVDLGGLRTDQICMRSAELTFRSVLAEFGAARLRATSWVNYADGVAENHDALISCNYAGLSGARATLVLHSTGRPIDAHLLARRITAIFEEHAAEVTKIWRESLN